MRLERILQDLRYAWRGLLKNPVFAASAIITLALGIGATTAVFSTMNAVMLRWLPVPNAQQLVYLRVPEGPNDGAVTTGHPDSSLSLPVFEALRRDHRVFSDLMAFTPLGFDKVDVRTGNNSPEQALGEMVSGNFFSGLGVAMTRGRTFSKGD
jgi:MacB-like periplasmic core domain